MGRSVLGQAQDRTVDAIVWSIRLPIALIALAVGAALGLMLHAGRRLAEGVPDAVLTKDRIAEAFGVETAVFPAPDGRMTIAPIRAIAPAAE